ncbi:ABC transporter permease [Bacteroidia bacterium]|nr:ABC transporter permease [Bacteroidia bacterium]GHT27576.1 ABC transporter permease [Bacteroidia bacterium]
MGNEERLGSAYRLAYRIQERYPEIEKICPLAPWYEDESVSIGTSKLKVNLLFADSTFFDFFDFKLYTANPAQVLAARNYAVISRTFARKAFGNEDPLGKSITLNDSVSVIVNGVMEDIKNSIIPYCDILVRIDNIKHFNPAMDSEEFNNAGSAYIFILEKENARLQDKADDMAAFFKEIFWLYKQEIVNKVQFIPLKEIYFCDMDGGMLKKGDWKLVMILMSVGLAILLFAITNYINLTVAQSGFRAKEMAARRLLGSTRQELFARLMLESTLLCLISFLLALFLAALCIPYANDLLATKIDIADAVSAGSIWASLCLILILGSISGWLPATLISNVNPLDIAKGSFGRRNKMVFSRFFIIFQNVITIVLLVASITMAVQTRHLIHAPLGYNTKNIIDVPAWNNKEEISVFANEVKQLASVKRVGFAQGTPFNGGNNFTQEYPDKNKNLSFQFLGGDTACYEMLNLQIIKDNHLGTSNINHYFGHGYLSQQAVKEIEMEEGATEIRVNENWTLQVDGVIRDIRLGNITADLRPVLFFFSSFESRYPWDILIETQGEPDITFEQIKQIYERVTQLDFNGKFVDDQIKESFASEQRINKIVMLFTAVAVLIALLGLLAMSTYFIRQRTKEIAVRKVHGAENFKVLSELVRVFLGYVLIAFVIAVPVSWYIMRHWLDDYAYRISLSPWIFIAAGVFCLVVSFISVYWQSRRAANANPVKALKSE